jgi:hypothetical protein
MLILPFLTPLASVAQDASALASKIEAVVYPPLARQARIQGDVRLRSGPDGVMLISGHPILAPVAASNLKDLGKLSEVEIEAIYHFVLGDATDIRVATRVEKKGNRFDRIILHAFMLKTEKVVEYTECVEHPVHVKNRIDLVENHLEVWIYGSVPCVQTETTRIALY